MTDFYSQNRCVCSTRSHGPLLCAFCLSFHFQVFNGIPFVVFFTIQSTIETNKFTVDVFNGIERY